MAKSKKGTSKAAAAAAAPKCTCDHPFKCTCGNRPERPSKGHKWDPDTQTWGGKGHKQKGASGQIALSAEAAETTSIGKTQIKQWERLPSTLLNEFCKQQKRKSPKFKNIAKGGGGGGGGGGKDSFKFRVILPDNKDPDKDLFFVPAQAVDNEEQAKEEACILALLQLTPTLPHERKLPEPYRTTWLHAIENIKAASNKNSTTKNNVDKKQMTGKAAGNYTTNNNNNNNSNTVPVANNGNSHSKTSGGGGGGGGGGGAAKASTSLTLGKTFISKADRQRQIDEKRRDRAKRIRQHEAFRMANKNHPVFLAAHLRQQIQTLLRGDTDMTIFDDLDSNNDNEESPEDTELDHGQAYVLERLRNEGFTKRQVLTALQSTSNDSSNVSEDTWDALYEECLQWLCIHLDEDQLPEGFDPRGGTLDVIVPTKVPANNGGSEKQPTQSDISIKNQNVEVSPGVASFASKYGIAPLEAKLIAEQAERKRFSPETILWQVLQEAAGVSLETTAEKNDEHLEVAQEELDALEAIFSSEFDSKQEGSLSLLSIKVADADVTIHAVVENGVYPFAYPKQLLLCGAWLGSSSLYGAAVHAEVIKFMTTLDLGVPMLFEIYGEIQNIFHSINSGEIQSLSLLPALGYAPVTTSKKQGNDKNKAKEQQPEDNQQHRGPSSRKPKHRPRERSKFWSTPPKKTAPAFSFPNISKSLDQARKSLPAFKARKDFLAAMQKAEAGCRVVLVTGDTGCGKTTQIPQFILEEAPQDAKIVVAQPRRLAATGVAARVASERGENQPGKQSVGYVVRGDSAMCASSRLIFCTTGVLLRQLQCEGALENITHIIVDEVHERHLDSDVLLGFLKLTLKDYPNLRVVLMSATLDADKFASYWGSDTPRIHIPGRTFPVTDFMLEDVLEMTGYIPPKNKRKKSWHGSNQRPKMSSPWNDSEQSDEESDNEDNDEKDNQTSIGLGGQKHSIPLEDLVKRVDETDLDYDLLARLVCQLVRNKGPQDDGSILVFLSGAPEINHAMEAVKRLGANLSLLVLPLHGGLQPKDQRLVFEPPRNGVCKVILSTNVAETSITIPDCTVVIDSCREKESSYDPVNRMPLLLEQFASKASLKQRRGRAGRVREGVCYKLISRSTFQKLKEHGDPEIKRCALESTLLSLLFLGFGSDFMNKLMDPPSKESVESALFSLKKLGAVVSDSGGALTPLGMHLAGIPAPPTVGKLLVMGSILGIRKAALAMAAGMSVGRSPFLRIDPPRNNRRRGDEDEQASIEDMKKQRVIDERKALFAKVGNSDHSMLVAAYMQWEDAAVGGSGRKGLCESLGLSFNGMRDMMQLVNQYDSSLRAAGYAASKDADRNATSWSIIRALAVAALAPSQLVRIQRSSTKYVETVEGAVEKDGVAKELKFFIRGSVEEQQGALNVDNKQDERVFIHPSSFNFAVGNYYCPFLVFHSMVRTSKPFLRDVSECSAYSLLLFGGDLEVRATEGIVVVDNWVKLDTKARIGSLIGGLRQRVDSLLAKKIDTPSFEIANTNEMKLIVKLLVSDGHG